MSSIDLNCDAGEGVGCETEIFPIISSANIACGGHAGDAEIMTNTLRLARKNNVVAGAHPGFPDRTNFGRVELNLTATELETMLRRQLDDLREQGEFYYVKPHGALYNLAARDEAVARTLVAALKSYDPDLWLLALSGGELWREGRRQNLRTVGEAFADRAYDPGRHLLPRSQPGSVLHGESDVAEQVLSLVRDQRVRDVNGDWVSVQAESICLHGDNAQAVAFARRIRSLLAEAGIAVRSFWRSS